MRMGSLDNRYGVPEAIVNIKQRAPVPLIEIYFKNNKVK